MPSAERVHIYIDGGNFHHLVLKKLNFQERDFSFEDFANFLANGRSIAKYGKRFYVGTVREELGNKKSVEAMSRQTKLFTGLLSSGWQIKTSKLRKRIEKIVIDSRVIGYQNLLKQGVRQIEFERMREKGIDVKLATDLIVGAVDNQYDTAIVVSSDGDLVPAIDWVRHRGHKKVEYIGFSLTDESPLKDDTKPSLAIISRTDIQRILVKTDLRPFIKPTIQAPLL
ncbi:MAG: NYN domain-containing protein [bacterium]|nr:NYN domain-containing protein [bacterium]